MKPVIQLLPAAQIDAAKWDRCIQQYTHGLIYSTTAYLYAMCDQWHGIVVNDYEAVMALPWRKKIGIRYAYTPAFIQQLGIIGDTTALNAEAILAFVKSFVSYADIHFNFSNESFLQGIPVTARTNLIIPLNRPLNEIRAQYRPDLKENVKKAQRLVYTHAGIQEAIDYFRKQYGKRMFHIEPADYQHLSTLSERLQAKGQSLARSVTTARGKLLAIALFLKDDKRIYNLMNTTLPAGRDKEANHFLLDSVIAEFAEQPLVLDLEGSDLPGVKKFYASFGPVGQPYFHYNYNDLPRLLRWLKH